METSALSRLTDQGLKIFHVPYRYPDRAWALRDRLRLPQLLLYHSPSLLLIPRVYFFWQAVRDMEKLPLRVGFIVNTFSFGGSETETIELVAGADPTLLRFTGIAVANPLPLPVGEPPSDGSFPIIYMCGNPYIANNDTRVSMVRDFHDAVRIILDESDIVITWGLQRLQEWLPESRTPKIVVLSKDSGEWAKAFLYTNSLATRYLVGNSSLAARAFPRWVQGSVTIIHDGINPKRVLPRLSRSEQRRAWGLDGKDKIAGYIGSASRMTKESTRPSKAWQGCRRNGKLSMLSVSIPTAAMHRS